MRVKCDNRCVEERSLFLNRLGEIGAPLLDVRRQVLQATDSGSFMGCRQRFGVAAQAFILLA
jgi:hypothetical protein